MVKKYSSDEERFWAKVNKTETCWLWTAYCDKGGYGSFSYKDATVRAHRFSLQLAGITIPVGYEPDHICNNTSCVNPSPNHIKVVTKEENLARRRSFNREKVYCKHGHAFDRGNTHITKTGVRQCKKCHKIREAERRKIVGK